MLKQQITLPSLKKFAFIIPFFTTIVCAQPGGENCATATNIPSIPFIGIGNTASADDDYYEICPDVGNLAGAPDHVYVYSTGNNVEYIDVSLCKNVTNYDSQLIVYENNCITAPFACQEDGCQSPFFSAPYNSELVGLQLQPNSDYYIVVDGYDANSTGNYQLNVDSSSAFLLPDSSKLPLIFINTLGQEIVDEPKINAHMGIVYDTNGGYNKPSDALNHYNGDIGIEIRGSSSTSFPKKGYAVETRDVFGANNNVSLFGMPKENDWVLHGPYSDKSLLRNFLSYSLGRKMYNYSPRTKFCELIVNNQYLGVYLFTEKIKRDKGRINISTIDLDDNSGDSITGGYIFKIDKFTGGNNDHWTSSFLTNSTNPQTIDFLYHYPKADEINFFQKNYIQSFVYAFESALYGPNFTDTLLGYRQYADINSFVDYFLLTESTKDVDGYRISTYLYKYRDSKGGKLFVGPPWDYNLGWGNADYCEGGLTSGWAYEINSICTGQWQVPFWWERLMEDPEFLNRINCRWEELRIGPFHNDSIMQFIDENVSLMGNAISRNFVRWDILDTYVWPNNFIGTNYAQELYYLKTWITDRLNWMDDNLPGSSIDCTFLSENEFELNPTISVFPNPFKDHFFIDIQLSKPSSNILIELFDINGKKLLSKKLSAINNMVFSSAKNQEIAFLPRGLFLITVSIDDFQSTYKLIKL